MTPKRNKLLTVLASLDGNEWKSLKKYLLRHTGIGSDNMDLIDYLYSKRNKVSEMSLQDVHTSQFGMMSSKAVMNMFSRVFLWAEEWISIEEMMNDQYQSDLLRIKVYNKKGLYHLADQLSQKLQNRIQKDELLDKNKTEALKTIAHYQYYSNNPIKSTQGVSLLQQLTENHLAFFKEESLALLLELHNFNNERGEFFIKEVEDIDKIIPLIKDTEITQMLQLCKALLVDHSYEAFQELCENIKLLDPQSEVHTLLYSYLTIGFKKLWHSDIATDSKDFIELINYGVNTGVYSISGKISVQTYHNLIEYLAFYSDQKTTAYYIDNWIDKVKTNDIKSVKSIAKAINNFRYERYDNIHFLLSNVTYESTREKTRGLCMQAIALYMTHQEDLLFDHLNNLKRLLKRNMKKARKNYYKSQLNLISVIELLTKKRYDSKVEINLSDYSPLFYKSWCLKECQ